MSLTIEEHYCPKKNFQTLFNFVYTRQDLISTSTTEESIAKDTRVNIAR